MAGGEGHIAVAGGADGFAVIQGFQFGQFIGVRFDQVGQLPQQAGALFAVQLAPRAALKGRAGGLHGAGYIFGACQGHLGQFPPAGRIEGGEGFAAGGCDPFAADEQFYRAMF